MRLLSLFLSILLISGIIIAQQKYLVSPNQEVIPIDKYSNPSKIIEKAMKKMEERSTSSVSGACGNTFQFGFDRNVYPPSSRFGIYHKDVLGQWYVAKATGTIDTVYWYHNGSIGPTDSTIKLRIHQSNINRTYGPGVGPWVYAPPCQSWGYWKTTNDADNGIAPFITDLTPNVEDTTWYSTINPLQGGHSIPPTTAPFNFELVGQGIGLEIRVRPFETMRACLACTGESPNVNVGDAFFISFRGNFLNQHYPNDAMRTDFSAWGSDNVVTTANENWPARNWKFYEHDSGPSNCAGTPVIDIKRGWVARGPFEDNPMYTAAYNIWYSMTVTTNVPPIIAGRTNGDPRSTFSNLAQTVSYDIWDCDPEKPDSAGVAQAWIEWSIAKEKAYNVGTDYVAQPPITMSWSGTGDQYDGDIPGQPAGTIVQFQVFARDIRGMENAGPVRSYKVTTILNKYYVVDTNYSCTHTSILATGTEIDTSAFFINNAVAGSGSAPKDDGTAGPFDLGGPFTFFGDTSLHYAWVGVNGAIALSKGANDTIDVNSNGYATTGWDLPMRSHHFRPDTLHPSYAPPNFIATMWADMIIGDSVGQYGKILTEVNGCKFTTEWNQIGTFDDLGPIPDVTTFRVILDRCTGVIEYQYDNVGTHGLDSAALVGMQADSNALTAPNTSTDPGYVYINRNLYPYQTKPRNDWCIKFSPGAAIYVDAGWRMLSVPNNRTDYSVASIYPDAVSQAFFYTTSYNQTTTMSNGPGYWLKFGKYTYAGAPGTQILDKVIDVNKGWNLMGSISKPVLAANVIKSSGLTTGAYWKYGPPYQQTDILMPGLGFWVKTNQAGSLELTAPSTMPKAEAPDFSQVNQVTIQDKAGLFQTLYLGDDAALKAAKLESGEWPPAAPEFDARFKNTNGMAVSVPTKLDDAAKYDYPISVTSKSPVTVRWEMVKSTDKKFNLMNGNKLIAVLEGTGSVRVQNTAGLHITIGDNNVPKTFALGQNYPNPFNPTTRFSVDVPQATNVDVVVYDLLGRKIATLMTGEQGAGSYQMEWNGTDALHQTVPTGIYFIRMTADKFSAVQKVMLMK